MMATASTSPNAAAITSQRFMQPSYMDRAVGRSQGGGAAVWRGRLEVDAGYAVRTAERSSHRTSAITRRQGGLKRLHLSLVDARGRSDTFRRRTVAETCRMEGMPMTALTNFIALLGRILLAFLFVQGG